MSSKLFISPVNKSDSLPHSPSSSPSPLSGLKSSPEHQPTCLASQNSFVYQRPTQGSPTPRIPHTILDPLHSGCVVHTNVTTLLNFHHYRTYFSTGPFSGQSAQAMSKFFHHWIVVGHRDALLDRDLFIFPMLYYAGHFSLISLNTFHL